MQAFVPKNRRPRFELILRIIDLNNIPLVNGTAFVKWRLPSSSAAEHHGHTDKAVILDHRAYWNYEKSIQLRLTIDRTQCLHECELHFEVIQEFEAASHGDTKNLLGRIKLNIPEYVDKSDDDEGVVRRYLMQDSKINSTLKIGLAIRQLEGDRNFTTPPLKSAMVFGGIAGVVSSEQDAVDIGRLPSLSSQSTEVSDLQDMYRRTLAASWNCLSDDLPADKLIEELFSGRISWSNETQDPKHAKAVEHELSPHGGGAKPHTSTSRLSPGFERRGKSSSSNQFPNDGKIPGFPPGAGHSRKAAGIDNQLYGKTKASTWRTNNSDYELSEFDIREDLRSWQIGGKE